MKLHTTEELEAMFREMGLGSAAERQRFLVGSLPKSPAIDAQVFIRVDAWTDSEQETANAELA